MNLSVWSGLYYDVSPEEAVIEYEKHGYRFGELCFQHVLSLVGRGDVQRVGGEFMEFARSHGFAFVQGHLSVNSLPCDKVGIAELKLQLDLMRAIGIKHAVLHLDPLKNEPELPMSEVKERNLDALRELVSHVSGSDLAICIENMRRTVPVAMSADDLLYFVNAIDSKNLGICFDIGHLNQTKTESPAEFIQKTAKHLLAVHINGNDGSCDQHIIPFGRDTADILSTVRVLRRAGFDGLFNFEISGERKCPIEIRGYKLDYIRSLYEYIMRETEN